MSWQVAPVVQRLEQVVDKALGVCEEEVVEVFDAICAKLWLRIIGFHESNDIICEDFGVCL